jgi:SAM-dependent methyltransferase
MEETFKSLEHQGWNERASAYDAYTARFTSYGIDPLIQAASIAPGHAVLDVCCGTGLVAQAAAGQGASVTGIDISEDMIAMAKAKGFVCQFQVGDAEALPFGDGHFDRVICNFGLYHLPEPDRAIAEAARVSRPDGVYAFTTWRGPDASPLFRVVGEAIQTHGTMDVGLPPAPPPFRLADRTESMRAMAAAGFGEVSFVDVPAVFECQRDAVLHFLEKSTVLFSTKFAAATVTRGRLAPGCGVMRTQASRGRGTGWRAPTARTPEHRSWRCRDSALCGSQTGIS